MQVGDFRKQQSEHPTIHVEGTAVEKAERFKFLSVHITDKLKWYTYTDRVVKKAQQCLFNIRRLKKCGLSPKTLTNFYRCTMIRQLHRPQPQDSPEGGVVCTTHQVQVSWRANYLPSMTPTAPDVTRRPKRSSRTLPLPVHTATTQKARLVQVHQSWDREIENSFYLKAIRLLNSNH